MQKNKLQCAKICTKYADLVYILHIYICTICDIYEPGTLLMTKIALLPMKMKTGNSSLTRRT